MDSDRVAFEADARLQQTEGETSIPTSVTVVDGISTAHEAHESSPLLGTTRRASPDRDGERTHSPPAWNGADDFAGLPWYRRPAVIWLAIPFLFAAMTFGATIVPLVNIIRELLCRDILNARSLADPTYPLLDIRPGDENEICSSDKEVQAQVAMFQLYAQAIGGILSALVSPKLGALSDRYGRLRLLAVTSLGGLSKDIFIIAIYYYSNTLSVWWFLLAYAIDGISGSFITGMALSHAFATDCTPPDKRAAAFAWFHGSLFAGIALGPLVAAYVLKTTGNLISMFWFALAFHVFFLAALFVIPESLSKRRQLEARAKHSKEMYALEADSATVMPGVAAELLPLRSIIAWFRGHNIFAPLKILYPTGPGSSKDLRRNLGILAAVDSITFGAAMGAMTVIILYTGATFHWDSAEQSIFMSIVNISRVTTLLVVLPTIVRLVRGVGSSGKPRENGCDTLDLSLIRIAVLFDTVGFIGYALAPSGGWMTGAGVLASIGGIASPTLQSSLTKHVPPHKIGALLGATGLLHALARVVAPVAFNFIYARTVLVDMPGTVFVVLAGSFSLAFVCSLFLKPGVYYDEKAVERDEREEQRQAALRSDERNE